MGMVLVGKYLVGAVGTACASNAVPEWRVSWFLHESPSGNGRDWKIIGYGAHPGVFGDIVEADAAALELGISRARELQGNEGLQPVRWGFPFPEVPQ